MRPELESYLLFDAFELLNLLLLVLDLLCCAEVCILQYQLRLFMRCGPCFIRGSLRQHKRLPQSLFHFAVSGKFGMQRSRLFFQLGIFQDNLLVVIAQIIQKLVDGVSLISTKRCSWKLFMSYVYGR